MSPRSSAPVPLFEALFESASDAKVVVDLSGRIRYVNRRAEVLFQYTRDEMLGHTVDMLVPERLRDIHERHRSGYLANPHARPMGAGLDLFGRRKDGAEFPVDIMLSPISAPEGQLVLAAIRDVTEQKEKEAALRESTAMSERLFEYAPDAVILVDGAGKILRINAQSEQMFGYERSHLLNQPIELLVPDRYKVIHQSHRTGYVNQPRTRPMGLGLALLGRRKDGTEFPVDIMLSPIETADGTVVLAVVRDITERRQAEEQEQVRRELRQKELLLQEIHHRVKNNLQVVSSLLNLQARAIGEQRVADLFRDAQDRVNAMALIHEQLYRSPGSSLVQFSDYVQSLVGRLLQSYAGESRGIRLELAVDPVELPMDTAIPCGLIVSELVSNAFKHAFPACRSGTISLRFESTDGRCRLTVRDDGVGLDEARRGSGRQTLGLQMVPALAMQLDGTFAIGNHPAGGTSAVVEFAVAPADAPASSSGTPDR